MNDTDPLTAQVPPWLLITIAQRRHDALINKFNRMTGGLGERINTYGECDVIVCGARYAS